MSPEPGSEDQRLHARSSEMIAAALRLPLAERAAFLEREAAGDEALLACASALLDSAHDLGDFLEGPGPGAVAMQEAIDPESRETGEVPERIGTCRILRLLGEGAMGIVYEGWQETLKRRVAVKVLRAALPTPQARRRFEREAELLGRLRHPGITEVYEAGFAELGPQRGAPYIVMELIDGTSITQHCEERHLGRNQRIELLAQACEAAGFAHGQGVLHRDYKPENVLVTRDGRVKLVDFGVACLSEDASATRYTRTGDVIGTLAYMSPEQAAGHAHEVDARADVHALGIIAFEVLVGRLPLDLGELSLFQALHAVRERDTIRMAASDPTLRGSLDAIVGKAVAIDRRHRYPDAGQMAADLRRFLAGDPVHASPPSLAERIRHRCWRHRRLVGALVAIVLALSLGLAVAAILAVREAHERKRADRMVELATWTQYIRAVGRAREDIERGNVPAAREEIERAAPALRGWEWRHLAARLDGGLQTLRLPLAADLSGVVASDRGVVAWSGSDAARATWSTGVVEPLALGAGVGPIAVSADARRLACWPAAGWTVRDIESDREGALLDWAAVPGASSAQFDPAGARVLLASNGVASVFDAETGARLSRIDVPPDQVQSAWSADGRRVAFAGFRDGRSTIEVHDALDGSLESRFPGPATSRIRFSPDGGGIVGEGAGRVIESWDIATAKRTWAFDARALSRAVDFTYSPDGSRIVVTTLDTEGALLDGADGHLVALLPRATRTSTGGRPAFSPDGTLLVVPGPLGEVALVDPSTGAPRGSLLGHAAPVVHLGFIDDGQRLVSVDNRGEARLWDSHAPAPGVLRGHGSYVYDVSFSPDGARLASGSWDGTVRLWEVASGDPIAVLRASGGRGSFGLARFSPTDGVLASVHDLTVDLWDTRSGRVLAELELPDPEGPGIDIVGKPPRTVAWRADGRLLAVASTNRPVHAWHVDPGSGAPPRHEAWPVHAEALAFAPKGDLVALAVGQDIELWDTEPPRRRRQLGRHDDGVFALAFSADVSRLASVSADRTVRVWSVEGNEPPRILEGHAEKVYSVAFSPDGTRIASGGNDDTIRIWDAASGDALVTLTGHEGYVHAVAFSPDGRVLASGSGDGTVRLWDVAPDRERLKARAERAQRVARLTPQVDALFAEEPDAGRVAALLAAGPGSPEDLRVALDLALARGTSPPTSPAGR